jgi:hypothetical protein
MKMHVNGQPVLGELRQALSAVFFGNSLFSPQEQLLANHRIHECDDIQQLTYWLLNAPLVAAKRQRLAITHPVSVTGHAV